MQTGDEIILKQPFILYGEDLGGRQGTIISTTGYILVSLHSYHSNPIKAFRNEIKPYQPPPNSTNEMEDDDWWNSALEYPSDWFAT